MSSPQNHGRNKRPYIILSNDDGIKSAGLKAVFNSVSGMADILVVAPDRERSGASHSFSIWPAVLRAKRVEYGGARAYSVSGTPVDCAKLALYRLAERDPDLFISGINHGPNTAQFIFYSGTIGAAAEAALLGIPSIAFSIDSYEPKEWSFAAELVKKIVGAVLQGGVKIRGRLLLNVNIPDTESAKIRGIKALPGGRLDYGENYIRIRNSGGAARYRHVVTGKVKRRAGMTDSDGIESGYVTITPLKFDLNDRKSLKKIKKQFSKLF